MRREVVLRKPSRVAIASLALLGCLTIALQLFSGVIQRSPEESAASDFIVTSLEDDGLGTLREAIFAAAESSVRVRIQLPPSRITLQGPLPPIVHRVEVVIQGVPGRSEIDAAAIGSGPVLDIHAPQSVLKGVSILNAPEQAVLVRNGAFTSTDNHFANCDQGVHTAPDAGRVVIEKSSFEANRVGAFLGSGRGAARIRNNRFYRHAGAAVWAVHNPENNRLSSMLLSVQFNHFEQDRIAIVLGNVPALVEKNQLLHAAESAVYLIGKGAVIRENLIRNGKGVGISADGTEGSIIDTNEIGHNAGMGILVRSSGNAVVRRNRIYNNGYGIAFVFAAGSSPNKGSANLLLRQKLDGIIAIGSSPILERNTVFNSGLAAFRLLDFRPAAGASTNSNPLLDQNIARGNQFDGVVRGDHRSAQ